MNTVPPALPFSGITVVSIEQAIAAPLASRHMADWGARVIKIERPCKGDFCRDYDKVLNGMSSQFVWTNRSKESLAIDIKAPEGKAALDVLLAKADVFIQNLAPGAAERQGLDAVTLIKRFPRLVACDISGYGAGGSYAQKKAYDLLVQCETGFLSINGTEDRIAKCGLSIVDIATGMYVLNGVTMALFNRERTGAGLALQVSLFDAMTEWMSYPALYTEGAGKPPPRSGTRHATIAPYGPFRCADGKEIFLAVQNAREWVRLCDEVLGQPGLATDPRFESNPARMQNAEILRPLIEAGFGPRGAEEVLEALEAASIANANLNSVEAFLRHEQLHARGRVSSVGSPRGPLTSYLPAVTIPGMAPVMGPVPDIGEHNAAILEEFGLSAGSREE